MFKENKEQNEVLSCSEPRIYLNAGAGTGKTSTILASIQQKLEDGVNQDSILVLTYNKDIQKEICNKLHFRIHVNTFHAFALMILGKNKKQKIINNLLSPEEEETLIRRAKNETKEKGLKKDFVRIIKAARENPSYIKHSQHKYIPVLNRYKTLLKEEFKFDFARQIRMAIHYLEKNPNFLKKNQLRYKYIYVDEFQDISEKQFKLLKLLVSPETFLFCAGDCDQAIYGWNGISENNVNKAIDTLNLKVFHLTQSYRLPKKIVDGVNQLLSHNSNSFRKNLISAKDKNGILKAITFLSEKDEIDFISKKVKQLHNKKGIRYQEIAILARSKQIYESFQKSLPHGIFFSTVHKAKGLEFKYVFVVGAEDGIFPMIPDKRTLSSKELHAKMNEERRVFAEAISRASIGVYITCLDGVFRGNRKSGKSPFLAEMSIE